MKNIKFILVLLILIPVICICCTCVYLTITVEGDSQICSRNLTNDLRVDYRYVKHIEMGGGVEVKYEYKDSGLKHVISSDKNIYKKDVISGLFLGKNFCDEIEVNKSGDVYLLGNSILIQEEGKFSFWGTELSLHLINIVNQELSYKYGRLMIFTADEFKIEEKGGRFYIKYDLNKAIPIEDSYNFNYVYIGEILFSVDYSKESDWKIEKLDIVKITESD